MPLVFPVDASTCRHILRLIAGTKYLSQLHVLSRFAGKGGEFAANSLLTPLEVLPDSVPKDSVEVYDKRVLDESVHLNAALGLAPVKSFPRHTSGVDLPVALLSRCQPYRIRCTVMVEPDRLINANLTARSHFQSIPIERLLQPFGHSLVDDSYPSEIALAQIMFSAMYPLFFSRFPWSVGSALQHGYFVLREHLAISCLEDALEQVSNKLESLGYTENVPKTAEHWLSVLEATTPSLWPFVRGGIVRRWQDIICFDLSMAAQSTLDFFRGRRLSGEVGNQRANKFELGVQGLFQGTAWDPPPRLRQLRCRSLRRSGRAITDLDALGVHQDTLMIVSCKSIIYDAFYDAGRYKAVRNASEVVKVGVSALLRTIADIRSNPIGDNFDFSEFKELFGIVCCPFAPYTTDSAALEFVQPGLRRACSAGELLQWLHT